MSVTREPYDERGSRLARCERCEMSWIESRDPVELIPGAWTTAGAREHECPEPYDIDVARAIIQTAASTGVPIHPSMKASAVLAYKAAGLYP